MKICEKCFGSDQVCYVCRGQDTVGNSKPWRTTRSLPDSRRKNVRDDAKIANSRSSKPTQNSKAKLDESASPQQNEGKSDKISRPKEQCPLCNVPIVSARLKNHVKNKCPARPKRAVQMSRLNTQAKEPPKQDKHACQICGINMSSYDLVNHMKEGCNSRRPESVSLDYDAPSVVYRNSDEDTAAEAFRQEFSDDHDAIKGQGQMFRENGAFGSHSSHDNFDDESFS